MAQLIYNNEQKQQLIAAYEPLIEHLLDEEKESKLNKFIENMNNESWVIREWNSVMCDIMDDKISCHDELKAFLQLFSKIRNNQPKPAPQLLLPTTYDKT